MFVVLVHLGELLVVGRQICSLPGDIVCLVGA
jgi:hypothetical protein